jgi:hypothetical protein
LQQIGLAREAGLLSNTSLPFASSRDPKSPQVGRLSG